MSQGRVDVQNFLFGKKALVPQKGIQDDILHAPPNVPADGGTSATHPPTSMVNIVHSDLGLIHVVQRWCRRLGKPECARARFAWYRWYATYFLLQMRMHEPAMPRRAPDPRYARYAQLQTAGAPSLVTHVPHQLGVRMVFRLGTYSRMATRGMRGTTATVGTPPAPSQSPCHTLRRERLLTTSKKNVFGVKNTKFFQEHVLIHVVYPWYGNLRIPVKLDGTLGPYVPSNLTGCVPLLSRNLTPHPPPPKLLLPVFCGVPCGVMVSTALQDLGLGIKSHADDFFLFPKTLAAMTICSECSIDFYLLDNEICNKCIQKQGVSATEKGHIAVWSLTSRSPNVTHTITFQQKGQCMACSLVYGELQESLCNKCCKEFASAESIPRALFDIPGASEQILNYQSSDSTSQLWEAAYGYKQTASDHRLGVPRAQNASLRKTPAALATLSKLQKAAPGIGKGPTLVESRKEKGKTIIKEIQEAREQSKRIRFNVSFSKYTVKRNGTPAAPTVLPEIAFVENIHQDDQIYEALNAVVLKAQEFHAQTYPLAAKLHRQMVTFSAFESATRVFRLGEAQTTQGTVEDLLQYFKDNCLVTKDMFSARSLALRLSVHESDLVIDLTELVSLGVHNDAGISSAAFPASARASSKLTGRLSVRSGSRAADSGAPRASAAPANRRTSAWRKPATTFARDPRMIEYKFKRYTVEVRDTEVVVTFLHNAELETILVASDWQEGLEASKISQPFHNTGFIGSGSAKNARIGTQEYALGQSNDINLSSADNATMLREEMQNLQQGEVIRQDFFAFAEELKLSIPKFQFNVGGAILGVLEPLDQDDIWINQALPFTDFIATNYLPCGPVDRPIQKFTGNTDCGAAPAPTDALTMAIHAFTHYVIVFTDKNLVLCDLQGMVDRRGIMNLIDPQSHSSQTEAAARMYWDTGPQGIQRFLDHHLESCGENSICTGLSLQTLEFDPEVEEVRPGTPPRVRPRTFSVSPRVLKKAKNGPGAAEAERARTAGNPIRIGTSLFSVEDFLRLNDCSRIS
ncbi:hypothetical protein C8J57DRAFT_1608161 [Mycena rebaudengoi]|nr:hypothetical protein C8J57DRAFT_1608161 [Mycena rebaudengoi]